MMNQAKEEDGGVAAPLLTTERSLESQITRNGGASISGAVLNISTTMIGAGIMSVPATMKVLGIIPGFVMIVFVAILVNVTAEFMLRYTKSGKSTTYAGLLRESFGSPGSVAVQVCVMITNLGCLVIYLIIIVHTETVPPGKSVFKTFLPADVLCGTQFGETLHLGILQEWFGIHWWNSRAYALLFLVCFVMLPLVFLRRVDSLRYSSAISILLAVLFIAISSGMAIYAMWRGKTQKLRLFPDFNNQSSVWDLFKTIPVFVTALGFHVNVHPIRAELVKPSDMSLAIRISLIISVAIYFSVGFFGYLLFGDSIMGDILVNFDQWSDSPVAQALNTVVRLSYALHLALVFPIMNFSLRVNIDELLFPKWPMLTDDTKRFVSLTCVLLALVYTIAIALPNIWYFFQIMGSSTIVCLSFIFPGAIILRDLHGISTTWDKIMAVLVIVLAVFTSSIVIYANLHRS